jgi:hypothetical protein
LDREAGLHTLESGPLNCVLHNTMHKARTGNMTAATRRVNRSPKGDRRQRSRFLSAGKVSATASLSMQHISINQALIHPSGRYLDRNVHESETRRY